MHECRVRACLDQSPASVRTLLSVIIATQPGSPSRGAARSGIYALVTSQRRVKQSRGRPLTPRNGVCLFFHLRRLPRRPRFGNFSQCRLCVPRERSPCPVRTAWSVTKARKNPKPGIVFCLFYIFLVKKKQPPSGEQTTTK